MNPVQLYHRMQNLTGKLQNRLSVCVGGRFVEARVISGVTVTVEKEVYKYLT